MKQVNMKYDNKFLIHLIKEYFIFTLQAAITTVADDSLKNVVSLIFKEFYYIFFFRTFLTYYTAGKKFSRIRFLKIGK